MRRSLQPYKKISIVSKPLSPPWNDSGKNLVKTLVDNIDSYAFKIFTAGSFEYEKENVLSESISSEPIGYELTNIQKINTLLRLLRPDPDIAAYHMFFAPYPAALLAIKVILKKIQRKKILFTICSIPKSEDTIKALSFADCIITLSDHTRKLIEKHGLKAITIPPSVDSSSLSFSGTKEEAKNEFGFKDEKIILYAGDYETLIDNDSMVSIIKKTASDIPDVRFVFACRIKTNASRNLEARLEEAIRDAGLDKHTCFMNEIINMHTLLAASELVIFPITSTYRKMDIPLLLIEALAYGIPIIISDIAPLNEIYKADIGAKINTEIPINLSSSIVDILKDQKRYNALSQKAKDTYEKRFSQKVMADNYKKLYDSLLGQKSGKAYYDDFSDYYDKSRQNPYHEFIDEITAEIAYDYIKDKDVIEVGCGTGRLLQRIRQNSKRITGADLSLNMLKASKARGFTVTQSNAVSLPFKDRAFDTAVSFKVLAHVPDIKGALAEMARVIKPDGHVIAEFYNPNSLRGLIKKLKPKTKISEKISDEDVYTRYDSIKDIRRYIPEDLEIIEIRGTRIITISAFLLRIPILSTLIKACERLLGKSFMKYLAGFLIIICRKKS